MIGEQYDELQRIGPYPAPNRKSLTPGAIPFRIKKQFIMVTLTVQ
jgi:hypothetical protein